MSGTTLDDYSDRYSVRTEGMKASEVRALFAVASRPEVVSLAGGMPYTAALPLDAIGDMLKRLVAERGAAALQYGSGQGDPTLREHICEVMSLEGIRGSAEDVVVTTGSQHALHLVSEIFLDRGDVVVAEAPSYLGALGTFSSKLADVVHVPMDDAGLIPGALRETLARLRRDQRRVKFLYTVPNFHNPAGVTLAEERRDEIVEIAEQEDLLIVEDNPYGLLGFDREPGRAMRARAPERVLYLGSFSKTFAPGFRVGWVLAPPAVRDKLVLANEGEVLSPSSFSQMAVSTYLETEPWQAQIKTFQELYRNRRDAMLESLVQLMPAGSRWTHPDGGFYVWLQLPEGIDAKVMLPRAVTARVAYVPGSAFYVDGQGTNFLRLSYCFPTPERIREGVRRLAGVVDEELDLVRTFGSGTSAPGPHGRRSLDSPAPDVS